MIVVPYFVQDTDFQQAQESGRVELADHLILKTLTMEAQPGEVTYGHSVIYVVTMLQNQGPQLSVFVQYSCPLVFLDNWSWIPLQTSKSIDSRVSHTNKKACSNYM